MKERKLPESLLKMHINVMQKTDGNTRIRKRMNLIAKRIELIKVRSGKDSNTSKIIKALTDKGAADLFVLGTLNI